MASGRDGRSGAADFDMTRFFDLDRMMKDLSALGVPGFDPAGLLEAQRKNIEAVVQANRVAAEGYQALAARQQEILREHLEQVQAFMREAASADTPEANAGRQAELMRIALEKALQNMRELAELAAKSQNEAFEVVNRRMLESLEEFRRLAEQRRGKA